MTIEVRSDGTTIAYVDADWKPVVPEKAVFIKIVYPDGRVVFATPVKKEARAALS